ncbi:hypothetical protein THRCLA_21683 [Thraustotheca clavata]|uniref:Uncharacterized protein n=1 Tax=Thraustotheca clavata TaxID=74557 RepID=A0A1V9ZRA7_9STRA|nr:hypothetical protein THRCLA_21683 [Thraustotheca clavata]
MSKSVFVHVLSTICTIATSKYVVDATHTLYKLSLSGFLPLQVWIRNSSYLKNFLTALEHSSEATVFQYASVFALVLQAAEKSSRVSIFMLVTPMSLSRIHDALIMCHMLYKVCATLKAIYMRLYKLELKQQQRHPNPQRLSRKALKLKFTITLRSVQHTSVSMSRRTTDSHILVPTYRSSASTRSSGLRTSSIARIALNTEEALAVAKSNLASTNTTTLVNPPEVQNETNVVKPVAALMPAPPQQIMILSKANQVLFYYLQFSNCHDTERNTSLESSVRFPDDTTSQQSHSICSASQVDIPSSQNQKESRLPPRLIEKPIVLPQIGPPLTILKATIPVVGPSPSLVPPAMVASVSCPGAPVHQENPRLSSSLLLIDLLLDEPSFYLVKPSLVVEINRRRKTRKHFEEPLQKAHEEEAYNNDVTIEPPRSRAESSDPSTNILDAYLAATECALSDFVEMALKPVLRNYFEKRILPLLAPTEYKQLRTRRSKQWRRHSSLIKM